MGQFKLIKNTAIRQSLQNVTRQYFVGNLKRAQILEFIKSEEVEIGITSYKEYTIEMPHRHSIAIEYQYMISGRTQYLDVDTGETHEFIKGDFFVISPGTTYAQRAKSGTEIFFIKVPSINDKQTIETNLKVEKWLLEKMRTVRKDYYHNMNAPKANSVHPAAAVALVSTDKKILMLKRTDSGNWTMPGGTMELGESLKDCAVREVYEETGLSIEIQDVIGIYTDPNIIVEYSDGEVRQEFTVLYYGIVKDGDVHIDDESTEFNWISADELLNLPMAVSQKIRVDDVIRFINEGAKRI